MNDDVSPESGAPAAAGVLPHLVPLSRRTGEPRVQWSVVVASVVHAAGAAWLAFVLFRTYYYTSGDYIGASWLMGYFRPEPSSLMSMVVPILFTLALLAPMVLCGITAWYALAGHRFTRWTSLAAVAAFALALLVATWPLWGAIAPAVGFLLLWLPWSSRYFATWSWYRQWSSRVEPLGPVPDKIVYGPLPRYRGRAS